MLKKILAVMLAVVVIFCMVPNYAVFAAARDIVTVSVVDENGNLLKGATVTATRNYTRWWTTNQTVRVTNNGDGTFTYDTSQYTSGTTNYYTISVEKTGYTAVTQQVDPDTRAVVIMMEEYTEPDNYVLFDVYYIATGELPKSFTASAEAELYGPSGDNVPLVTINVNVSKLKSAEYADCVVYEENNGNAYHFVPAGDADDEADKEALLEPFWAAVVECMDEESVEAFEDTGLFDSFRAYCLKNQGSAQNPDNHCDGILKVVPPVYVVEMNDRGTYFGGMVNDETTSQFTKYSDVLADYNAHFGQNIQWADNNDGTYSGAYIEGKYRYVLKIQQTNIGSVSFTPENDEQYVKYAKQTDKYYLATFDAQVVSVEQVEFTVTYSDGLDNDVFNAQVDALGEGQKVTAFEGDASRENYDHIGWVLEGGDGTVLSQADILAAYPVVTSDLTFIAVYELKPETFAGVVEVVLDGTYADGVASGDRVDITTVKHSGTSLYVSADDSNYIPLEKTATGVYTAKLENGVYHIYYFDGTAYTRTSDQQLVIQGAPRTRYLFFNSVTYNLNGGIGGPAELTEYYETASAVSVSSDAPTKDGYLFMGWLDEDDNLYQSGAQLTASIGEAYTLTAQWEKEIHAKVNVTVIVDTATTDGAEDTELPQTMEIDLTYRTAGSSEDYVEVVGQEVKKDSWFADGTADGTVTTTMYTALFDNLSTDFEYSTNVFLEEYEVTERTVSLVTDADGNLVYNVTVRLKFDPDQYMFVYDVVEHIDNDALVPDAVDIKVMTWYDMSKFVDGADSEVQWYPIIQHINATHDVLLDEQNADDDFVGSGSYMVWGWEDKGNDIPYYYRAAAVGFTLADGTEIVAVSDDNVNYTSLASANGLYPAGAYTATVEVNGGASPDGSELDGAHFQDGQQVGTVTVHVYAHPHTVTFDPNGGTLGGTTEKTDVSDLFVVPALDSYVPTKSDAYVFGGWYVADEDGNITDETVSSGEALTGDITLIAKWKEPLTVEGLVTVGATYEQVNEDGSVSTQTLYEADWARTATVLLQRIDPNGYFETIHSAPVVFDYTDEEYYYLGKIVGYDRYSFENIPDDGTYYRVQLLLPNYVTMFQNEPESVTKETDYQKYTITDYEVLWGSTAPAVGTVNIHNHFDPEEFTLEYEVDASAIGDAFRPDSVEILVTSDDEPGNTAPSTWPVISQMVFSGGLHGDDVALSADGFGSGSDEVWISHYNGVVYYQYGIRLYRFTVDGVTQEYTADLPFTVTYQDPAHYHYGAQSQMLVATLVPNTYEIRYELNGGTMEGTVPDTHTWSYETALNLPTPKRQGFVFLSWYLDADFTEEASDAIAADVAEDTVLYAKWEQTMDVVDLTVIVDHSIPGGGLANNYDKTLYAQLTRTPRGDGNEMERVFTDVEGYQRDYPNGLWHTRGDYVQQDVFQVPAFYTGLSAAYDYSVNVTIGDYNTISKTITKTAQPDGSTLHKVVVVLQYNPKPLDLEFYVRMDDSVAPENYPASAEVKVTSWFDTPTAEADWQWYRISLHELTTVTVPIDSQTGDGTGSYPVWQWYNEEENIPYHYRVEIVQLNFADGTTVAMNEAVEDVAYTGGGYRAEIETAGGDVPTIPDGGPTTDLEGVYGAVNNNAYVQRGTVGAVIDFNRVVFHANNDSYEGDDAFRTYYPADTALPEEDGYHHLNTDGTVGTFYDIPEFAYLTHNDYIFKGWYLDKDSEDRPFDWKTSFEGDADVYAHWINVGSVDKEAGDSKNTGTASYREYDLVGAQIRDAENDNLPHYGTASSGLRFVTVLSEEVYGEINALAGNENGAEYGFVMAKSSTVEAAANGQDGYTLQYRDANVNGVDTTAAYSYVQNLRCDGVADHYNGEAYRLYTAVITYNDLSGAELEAAYASDITARSYIRYYDANGLYRTYYNNYTGTSHYGGCSTSFAAVRGMMGV